MKMKWCVTGFLLVLCAGVQLRAQSVHTLVSFNGTNGNNPSALTLGNDGNFYGTTVEGGTNGVAYGGYGTVFKVTPNGTLTSLVSFNDATTGEEPYGGLTLGADGNFYGTTYWTSSSDGSVFKVTPNGTLTTLFNNFVGSTGNANGGNPRAGLTLGTDGNFYGTTYFGGSYGGSYGGYGTVFKVTTTGSLTTLDSFNGTNGKNPVAALTLGTDGNFYSTTYEGGITNSTYTSGMGTVFKVTQNGTLTTLTYFNGTNGAGSWGLTLGSDGNFYGTTEAGGSYGFGTVFMMSANGTLNTLVSFNGTNGKYPQAALTLGSDGNFYGTTYNGGSYGGIYGGYGTVFKVTTNGTLTTLVSFAGTNGQNPNALTLGSDGNFYGTTVSIGSSDYGTVFRLLLPPIITVQPQSETNTVGNAVTFLVCATSLTPLAYQWQFNGTNLFEATNTTLTLPNAFPTNAGAYTVVITNTCGSVTSNPAMLIELPLDITAPTMLVSGQYQFSFDTATGVNYAVEYSTNLTQWFPWVTLGGTGVPLTLIDPNTAGTQQRFYRVSLSPQ